MHIRRWSWSDWLAIVIATTLIAFIFLEHRGDSVRSKSKKVQLGMTRRQVEAIMGKGTNSKEEEKAWSWHDKDGGFFLAFDDKGKVEMMQYNRADTFMAKVRELIGLFLG